ncbi:replicative DNA helicase [mine drainage metagenome]|uniref:DNA 5'-3' helicase n=3 Tax=mine drainage metagenome TaxID=410659 RepID=T1AKL9_9ZZZZ
MNASHAPDADRSRIAGPPHSDEAEQAFLGGLLLDNSVWPEVSDMVRAEDFYRRDHQVVFEALFSLFQENKPVDLVTASEQLEQMGRMAEAGGMGYLMQLVHDTPTAANTHAYAAIIREYSLLRQLIHVGTEVTAQALRPEGRSLADILNDAESRIFRLSDERFRGRDTFADLPRMLHQALDRIDALYHSKQTLTGVATGLVDFDRMTSGLQRGDLIVVAGRPSSGKTSFALNIAEHAAIKHQVPTAIFSMEMSAEQLVLRFLASLGRIDQSHVRTGQLEEADWPRLTATVQLLTGTPLYIDDIHALSPAEVLARARRLKHRHGLGLVIVDYLQLMQVPRAIENRTMEISEISRGLKAMARELDVPVIAISQLNRNLEQRPNKRPVMSDLRDSGTIEQDADLIVFIYRDEMYNSESTDKGIAEIIIGKHRNGPIGDIRLTFLAPYTRFENLASESRYG